MNLLLFFFLLITPSSSAAIESFVYGGCSQSKYLPGSPYQNAINSLLTSVINSATFTTYNNFTIPGSTSSDTLYGVFQCRGDISGGDCSRCVSHAVTQLGTICVGSSGGALQLDGCFVKYDNTTFLGVEDKTVVMKKCGPQLGIDSDALTRRDSVLGYMQTSIDRGAYRVGSSGELKAVAQCVEDLVSGDCQDCLTEAIGRLKTDCAAAKWGDMFLAKCYARYSEGGNHSPTRHGKSAATLIIPRPV